jgi:hypothetical protein
VQASSARGGHDGQGSAKFGNAVANIGKPRSRLGVGADPHSIVFDDQGEPAWIGTQPNPGLGCTAMAASKAIVNRLRCSREVW